jgi:hypothetical protein
MFDSTYIPEKFKTVWDKVFTDANLNTDNVILYYNFRDKSQMNKPSVLITQLSGVTNVQRNAGANEGISSQPALLSLWNRVVSYKFEIIAELKGEFNKEQLYAERLYSLFLREFKQGQFMDAGTNYESDGITPAATNDIIRRTVVGPFRSTNPIITNLENTLEERLEIIVDVQFYEKLDIIS